MFANTENEEKCNLCADSDLFLWDDIERVTVHFPPGADVALRYTAPTTGREGAVFHRVHRVPSPRLWGGTR